MCIPYALYVLEIIDGPPYYCNPLGLAYVIALTVSMFNLLAIVIAEAYAFHEKNVNYPDEKGSGIAMSCVFGIVTIYIGSVILHLGPTLIGGEFKFNDDIGNCIFAYGKVQVFIFVVHIWHEPLACPNQRKNDSSTKLLANKFQAICRTIV